MRNPCTRGDGLYIKTWLKIYPGFYTIKREHGSILFHWPLDCLFKSYNGNHQGFLLLTFVLGHRQSSNILGYCGCLWWICLRVKFMMSQYSDIIMSATASQCAGVSMVCSTVCSGADQRKHQSSGSLAFVWKEFAGDRWIPITKVQ